MNTKPQNFLRLFLLTLTICAILTPRSSNAMIKDEESELLFVRTTYTEGSQVHLYKLTVDSSATDTYFLTMKETSKKINRGVYRVATELDEDLLVKLRGGLPVSSKKFQMRIHGTSYILIELTDERGTYGWIKARESDILRPA